MLADTVGDPAAADPTNLQIPVGTQPACSSRPPYEYDTLHHSPYQWETHQWLTNAQWFAVLRCVMTPMIMPTGTSTDRNFLDQICILWTDNSSVLYYTVRR